MEPLWEEYLVTEACGAEHGEAGGIVGGHYSVELVQVEFFTGIDREFFQGGSGVAFATLGGEDGEAELCPVVGWRVVEKVEEPHGFVGLDDEAQLLVGVEVVTLREDVVLEVVATVGRTAVAYVP